MRAEAASAGSSYCLLNAALSPPLTLADTDSRRPASVDTWKSVSGMFLSSHGCVTDRYSVVWFWSCSMNSCSELVGVQSSSQSIQ
eukprot:3600957-Rhodomonas_salina.1